MNSNIVVISTSNKQLCARLARLSRAVPDAVKAVPSSQKAQSVYTLPVSFVDVPTLRQLVAAAIISPKEVL